MMARRRLRLTSGRDRTRETQLHLSGPFDRWGCIRLRFKLLMRLAKGITRLTVDLRRVPYIDSDGLKMIRWLRDDWKDLTLEIINANKSVTRTLMLSHLDDLIADQDREEPPVRAIQ